MSIDPNATEAAGREDQSQELMVALQRENDQLRRGWDPTRPTDARRAREHLVKIRSLAGSVSSALDALSDEIGDGDDVPSEAPRLLDEVASHMAALNKEINDGIASMTTRPIHPGALVSLIRCADELSAETPRIGEWPPPGLTMDLFLQRLVSGARTAPDAMVDDPAIVNFLLDQVLAWPAAVGDMAAYMLDDGEKAGAHCPVVECVQAISLAAVHHHDTRWLAEASLAVGNLYSGGIESGTRAWAREQLEAAIADATPRTTS